MRLFDSSQTSCLLSCPMITESSVAANVLLSSSSRGADRTMSWSSTQKSQVWGKHWREILDLIS